MARSREGRPPHHDDGEASQRSKHPGSKHGKRGSRKRASDSGLPSLATAHDVMMLTRAERAALSDQAFDQSLQKLTAEQDRIRNLRAKGQLQERIEEMRNERTAAVTAESPVTSSKQTPETPVPPIERAEEPSSEPAAAEASPTDQTPEPAADDKKVEPEPLPPLADLGSTESTHTPPPAEAPIKPPDDEITEEELRKILGDDYDAIVGKGSETAQPVSPDTDTLRPDTAPPLADLGGSTESPTTPTRPVERRSLKDWGKPNLNSAPEVWGLTAEDLAQLSPTELATARQTLSAKLERYVGRNKPMIQQMENQLRRIDQFISGETNAPTEPEPSPAAIDTSAKPEPAPDAAPEPVQDLSPDERDYLENYRQIFRDASDEQLATAADDLDIQTDRLIGAIDQCTDPDKKAKLQQDLNFVRARRDIVSYNIITRRDQPSATSPSETDPTPTNPDAIPPNTSPDVPPQTPDDLTDVVPTDVEPAETPPTPEPTTGAPVETPTPEVTTHPVETPSSPPFTREPVIPVNPPSAETPLTPPGSPERREATEPHEPTSLEQARANAARALLKRGQIFGRTGDKELNAALLEYQTAIATEQQTKIDQIKQEFSGRDMTDPATKTKLQARLVEFALSERFDEETALRDAMKSSSERGAGLRFKNFWKKNSGKRALIGAGLFGATLATGGLAVPGLLAARVGMLSVGTTMMAEAGVQGIIDKYGDTRKLTAEQVAGLTEPQLRNLLAAHITRFGERGDGEFGVHTDKFLKKTWSDDTGKKLLDQYRTVEKQRLEGLIAEHPDATPEDILARVLSESLDEQNKMHRSYASSRTSNRKMAMFKWTLAIASGALAGTAVALSGLERIRHIKDAKAAAQGAIEHGSQATPTPDLSSGAGAATVETGGHAGEAGSHATTSVETSASATVEAAQQAAERAASFREVAHKGDTLWKLTADQLLKRLGESFENLDPARKTYLIDSIKDRIAAHPQEFGLTDINRIDVNQTIDFTAAFEGPHAVNLPEVVTQAKELSQTAVDSITHNNEVIRQWLTSHPGEALNDNVIHNLIHGTGEAAQVNPSQTAELLGASHEQVATVLTDRMTHNMIRQGIINLAETNPELYARFSEMNPDCYPPVAGVTEFSAPIAETAASNAAELSTSHLNAVAKSMKVFEAMPHNNESREALHTISELKLSDAIKPNALSVPLEQAGVDHQTAHETETALRKVFSDFTETNDSNTKVKTFFGWMHKRL